MYDYQHIFIFIYFQVKKLGFFLLETKKLWSKQCEKRVFWIEQNIWSKSEGFLFILKWKKCFPFIWLYSENNLVGVKQKIGNEKKRRKKTEFLKWTSETHAKWIQFHFISLISQNCCLVKQEHPSPPSHPSFSASHSAHSVQTESLKDEKYSFYNSCRFIFILNY